MKNVVVKIQFHFSCEICKSSIRKREFNLHLIFIISSLFSYFPSYDNFLREYARLSLYGYFIAASFLQILHDPVEFDFNSVDYSLGIDYYVQQAWRQGGEVVNYELAGLIFDMYKLHEKLNIDLA